MKPEKNVENNANIYSKRHRKTTKIYVKKKGDTFPYRILLRTTTRSFIDLQTILNEKSLFKNGTM